MGGEITEKLLELAAAVSEPEPIDWHHARQDAPDLAGTIRRLEQIAEVASAHRLGQPPRQSGHEETVLFRWGHLEVLEKLGEGSFGEVYRARDTVIDRQVALKLRRRGPTGDEGSGRRFIGEAQSLARIDHPNVLKVHGADLHDGRVGLWTELVRGCTLDELLASEGERGPREVVAIGLDLCRALAAVHLAGLVHSDVKAANVIRATGGRIVLADLGSGRAIETRGDACVSPLTTAPEVLCGGGAALPASDLYSLGVLLYRLLSNRYPIETEDFSELVRLLAEGRQKPLCDLRPELEPQLIRVIERALESDPQRRFATAGEMERALAAVFSDEAAPLPGPPSEVRRPLLRVPALVAVLSVAVTIVLATLVWLSRSTGPRPETAPPPLPTARPMVVESAVEPPVEPAVAEPVAPVSGGPVADSRTDPRPASLEIASTLYRSTSGVPQPLSSGSGIRPGDLLYLEVTVREAVHLYVLNGDEEGKLFVLFPLAGLELGNPLPVGRHYLPGHGGGIDQDWQVTSSGGTESFLVVAARSPLPELEDVTRILEAASADREVDGSYDGQTPRGVGGLGRSPAGKYNPYLQRLADRLVAQRRRDGSVWVQRLELNTRN